MKQFGIQKGHVVDFLFTLALFCVFAASALMVVIIGANVYRQTVDRMNGNYDSRTSLTYLTEKIRQNDAADAVKISSVGESPALVLSQRVHFSSSPEKSCPRGSFSLSIFTLPHLVQG